MALKINSIDAFLYKKWADERTLKAIKNIDANAFPDLYAFALQQLNHMVIVEELFYSRMTNHIATHKSTNTLVIPELDVLENRLMCLAKWYTSSTLEHENEEECISFTFTDGKRGMMTRQEMLFHIINHGSYHRGNIAHALDLAMVPHPIDGYAIYIHEKEPGRRKI